MKLELQLLIWYMEQPPGHPKLAISDPLNPVPLQQFADHHLYFQFSKTFSNAHPRSVTEGEDSERVRLLLLTPEPTLREKPEIESIQHLISITECRLKSLTVRGT